MARRTISSAVPEIIKTETQLRAEAEATAIAAALGCRKPSTTVRVLPQEELPHYSERREHLRSLQASEEDIYEKERRDLSDFEQREKVERQRQEELQTLLAAEKAAEEQQRLEQERREAEVQRHQHETRLKLRETYGQCFLWDEKKIEESKVKQYNRDGLDAQVVSLLETSKWIDDGLSAVAK